MKTHLIKVSDREEGPYDETQMAQMFADGRIDRNTPCKPTDRGDWKTIDDYLPMLKYGTQLPPPVDIRSIPPVRRRANVVGATRLSRGFRYSVLVGSKNNVQMDGRSIRCLLLLRASDRSRLDYHHGSVRSVHWRCDVESAASVMRKREIRCV